MRTKDPNAKREIEFVHGCALEPADALRAWLDAQGKRLLRVPLVIHGAIGPQRAAKIGSLAVRVTDAALGISLAMRAHGSTGEVGFVAEGHWTAGVFAVVHASSKPVDPASLPAYVEIEKR